MEDDEEFFTWVCSQLDEREKEKLKYFAHHLVNVEHCKMISDLSVKIQCWYFRNRKDILSVLCFLSVIIAYLIVRMVIK